MNSSTPHTTMSRKSDNVDVSMLVTFHNEGILAHLTLNSLERCRQFANNLGLTTEYVWIFDSADNDTKEVVLAHPAAGSKNISCAEVSHRDLGASRNTGIALCSGKAIAILDGDDYYSTNWISSSWRTWQDYGPNAILHPEMVINFGAHAAYGWHVDQLGKYYSQDGLLTSNYWTSWTFASRAIYTDCPYITTNPQTTGFGYEDWHWNCETIARGYVHRTVEGTIGFYRRKAVSLVNTTTSVGAIIPPTQLFGIKSEN